MNKKVPNDNSFDEISFIYKKLITKKNCTEKRIPVQILMKKIESKSQTNAYLVLFIFYPYKISFH